MSDDREKVVREILKYHYFLPEHDDYNDAKNLGLDAFNAGRAAGLEEDYIETLDSVCRFLGKDADGNDVVLTWRDILAYYDANNTRSLAEEGGRK